MPPAGGERMVAGGREGPRKNREGGRWRLRVWCAACTVGAGGREGGREPRLARLYFAARVCQGTATLTCYSQSLEKASSSLVFLCADIAVRRPRLSQSRIRQARSSYMNDSATSTCDVTPFEDRRAAPPTCHPTQGLGPSSTPTPKFARPLVIY